MSNLKTCSYLVLLCLLVSTKALAQKDSTQTERPDSLMGKFFGLPVLFSSPETRLGFGALVSYTFDFDHTDTISPPSNIQLAGAYTQNKQVLFFMPYQVYWKERKYTMRGELGYYRYTYLYFGFGENTITDGELYAVNFPRVRFTGLYRYRPNLYLGVQWNFDAYNIKEVLAGGLLDQGAPGSEGGNISGIGPVVEYDTRDNVYASQSGVFLRTTAAWYNEALGSDFNWLKYRIDLRKFMTYKEVTLATQLYFETNTAEVPFYQMARIGGTKLLRGYYQGREQDRQMIAAQAELRRDVIWRLGVVAFAGVAETYKFRPDGQRLHWSGGAGIRLAIDKEKRINLRADYALGEGESSGLYFTIGEAF